MSVRPTLLVLPDAAAVADHVSALLVALVLRRPRMVLGLATGSTPLPVYRGLVAACPRGDVSFRQATSVNLDEYIGLGPRHPASFRRFMQHALFGATDFRPSRTHVPDGMAADPSAEAACYECAIRLAGGVDPQLLGIGSNGHIGFNEPGSALTSRTRAVSLARATRAANRRFFPASMALPVRALTMGIATILEARQILLIATGAAKAKAVARAVHGPVSTACPASALRLHPNALIVCDGAAAAELSDPRERD